MALPAPIHASRPLNRIAVATGNNRISDALNQTTTPGTAMGGSALTETHQFITNLPALATVTIPLSGISYYIEFLGTTGGVPNNFSGLSVRAINAGQPRSAIVHVQGTGLRFGTIAFNALEVTNLDAANTARFTVDIGGGIVNNTYDEYIDKRVVISQSAGAITIATAAGVPVLIQNEPTTIVGFKSRTPAWADTLAGGATQAVTDTFTAKGRRSIIFSNDDAANLLFVFDANGNNVGSVYPQTAFYLEVNGTITLKNPNVGAIICHIGETYYT